MSCARNILARRGSAHGLRLNVFEAFAGSSSGSFEASAGRSASSSSCYSNVVTAVSASSESRPASTGAVVAWGGSSSSSHERLVSAEGPALAVVPHASRPGENADTAFASPFARLEAASNAPELQSSWKSRHIASVSSGVSVEPGHRATSPSAHAMPQRRGLSKAYAFGGSGGHRDVERPDWIGARTTQARYLSSGATQIQSRRLSGLFGRGASPPAPGSGCPRATGRGSVAEPQWQLRSGWSQSQRRFVIQHPARVVLGHKMELIRGNHGQHQRFPKPNKFPAAPSEENKNMNLLTTYADMKLRWKYS